MLSPRSRDPMAFRTPATCHSFTSRYSLSASAARNDRLRPVLFASFSSRFLTSVSTRTVNVVEDMALTLVIDCIHNNTKMRHGKNIDGLRVLLHLWYETRRSHKLIAAARSRVEAVRCRTPLHVRLDRARRSQGRFRR